MLGSTHGINAVLERKGLARVAVLRLGGPATESVPPLISWPRGLREAVVADMEILPGGYYVEGRPFGNWTVPGCGPSWNATLTASTPWR